MKQNNAECLNKDYLLAYEQWQLEARMAHRYAHADADRKNESTRGDRASSRVPRYRTVTAKGYLILESKKYYIGVGFAGLCITIRYIGSHKIEISYGRIIMGYISTVTALLAFYRD